MAAAFQLNASGAGRFTNDRKLLARVNQENGCVVEAEAIDHRGNHARQQFILRERAGGIAGDFRRGLQFQRAALRLAQQALFFDGNRDTVRHRSEQPDIGRVEFDGVFGSGHERADIAATRAQWDETG